MGEPEKHDDDARQWDEDQRDEGKRTDDGKVNPLAPPINVEPGS